MKKLVIGSVLVLGLIAGYISTRSSKPAPSAINSIITSEHTKMLVVKALVVGCVEKAKTDENMYLALLESHGQLCQGVVSDLAGEVILGKSVCAVNDVKCLFSLGYVRAAITTGQELKDSKEVQDLEEDINKAFSEIFENKG